MIFKNKVLIDDKSNRWCPFIIITYLSQLLIFYHSTMHFFLYKVILPTPRCSKIMVYLLAIVSFGPNVGIICIVTFF